MGLILSTVLQLVLFTAIPYAYWRSIKGRKQGFFTWVGLKPIQTKSKKGMIELGLGVLSGIVFFIFLGIFVIPKMFTDPLVLAQSQFSELTITSIFGILVYAFIQTGLSEEILFRGFLGKFFMKRLGYFKGNLIQATLFGLLHGLLFFGRINIISLLIVTLLTGAIGYFMGYLNERKAGGSIIPGWITHGLANTLAAILFIILF